MAERLSADELRSLAERLQGDPPDALIRRDKKYAELGLQADGLGIDEVVAILVEHPSLLQRPILDDGQAAMIGRPRSRAADWAAAAASAAEPVGLVRPHRDLDAVAGAELAHQAREMRLDRAEADVGSSAISLLVRPRATVSRTCSSRPVSGSVGRRAVARRAGRRTRRAAGR